MLDKLWLLHSKSALLPPSFTRKGIVIFFLLSGEKFVSYIMLEVAAQPQF